MSSLRARVNKRSFKTELGLGLDTQIVEVPTETASKCFIDGTFDDVKVCCNLIIKLIYIM